MHIERLDHVNVVTADLDATRDFYVEVLGLRVGERPPFHFAGYWLYDDAFPVIHINECEPDDQCAPGTGAVNHIAFRAAGLAALRERLQRRGIPAHERSVPRNGEVQIFIIDPNGVRIELTFAAAEVPARERLSPGAIYEASRSDEVCADRAALN